MTRWHRSAMQSETTCVRPRMASSGHRSSMANLQSEYTPLIGQSGPSPSSPANRTTLYLSLYVSESDHTVLMEYVLDSLLPLDDTLGAESSRFIMNHSKVPVLVLSTLNIPKILAQKDHMPYLKYLVSMDASSSASGPHLATLRSWCAEKGVQLIFWDEIMARYGGDHSKIATRPSTCLDDVTTICYTSGTTGEPKGALLTQRHA